MPQAANIVVNDRESTPVAHTFEPRDVGGSNVAVFAEDNGVVIGEKHLVASWRKNSSNRKMRLTLTLPTVVTETINSVDNPKVARTIYVDATFTFPDTSTEQERDNAVGMFAGLLVEGSSIIEPTLIKNQAIW